METFKYTKTQLQILKEKDQRLKAYIEKVGKIKREINPDLFAELIRSIVSQQISTKAALTVWTKVIALVKDITPENILLYDEDSLRKCGLSLRKVNYIFEAAKRFASKEFDAQVLKTLPNDMFIKELTKIKGVGIWTAEMLLIFSLNRMNVFSFNDLGIKRGMKILYNLDDITKDTFSYYQDKYSPFCSLASLYLWDIASKMGMN